jgi:hypothetical protein
MSWESRKINGYLTLMYLGLGLSMVVVIGIEEYLFISFI